MNTRLIGLTAILWFSTSALGTAQQEARTTGSSARIPEQQARMYEDIEIMRRLLERTLLRASDFGAQGSRDDPWNRVHVGNFWWTDPNTASRWLLDSTDSPANRLLLNPHVGRGSGVPGHDWGEVEGIYLRGQGVVYSITMPVPHHWAIQPERAAPVSKPPSPWEQVRQELRGERVAAEEKQRERQRPSLTEALLKVLADNGHHFSLLPDREQLTVAITFRGPSCTQCHAVG